MLFCNQFSAMLRSFHPRKHLCYSITVFYVLLAIIAFFNNHSVPMETDHRVKRGTDNLDGTQQCGTLRIYRELDTGRCVSRCHKGYLTHRTGLTSGECKPCESPCRTCAGRVDFCRTCIEGYMLESGECRKIHIIETLPDCNKLSRCKQHYRRSNRNDIKQCRKKFKKHCQGFRSEDAVRNKKMKKQSKLFNKVSSKQYRVRKRRLRKRYKKRRNRGEILSNRSFPNTWHTVKKGSYAGYKISAKTFITLHKNDQKLLNYKQLKGKIRSAAAAENGFKSTHKNCSSCRGWQKIRSFMDLIFSSSVE